MIEYDEGEFPITRVSIRGRLQDTELEPFLEKMDEWIDRGAKVTILDLSENRGIDVRHLRRMSSWLNRRRDLLAVRRSTTMMVLTNGFLRASADIVFKLAPNSGNYVTCPSVDIAYEKARTIVEAGAN